jgi:hypothetical protein
MKPAKPAKAGSLGGGGREYLALAGLAGFIDLFACFGGFALGGGLELDFGFWVLKDPRPLPKIQKSKIQNPKAKC